MKKLYIVMCIGIFIVISLINIVLVKYVPIKYDPFPNTVCTKQIYNSFIKNNNFPYIQDDYYETADIYKYISTINLDDNIDKCDELNNIKSIYYLNIDIKNGNLDVINVVKDYKYRVGKITIKIYNQEAFDLSPLKELNKIYKIVVSESFVDYAKNREVLTYLEDKGCILEVL